MFSQGKEREKMKPETLKKMSVDELLAYIAELNANFAKSEAMGIAPLYNQVIARNDAAKELAVKLSISFVGSGYNKVGA